MMAPNINGASSIRQHLAHVLEQYRSHARSRSADIVHELTERVNERGGDANADAGCRGRRLHLTAPTVGQH